MAARQAAPWQLGPPAHPTPKAAEYAVRHLLNSFVGCSALLATSMYARRLRPRYHSSLPSRQRQQQQQNAPSATPSLLPLLAGLLLVTMPRFYGHFFANTKDVPFAAAFAWSMVAIVGTLNALLPTDSRRPALNLPFVRGMCTAALAGFTISLRSAGLLLLPLAGVGALATLYN
eukprot:COSAG01_NODE_29135_length_644_cov_2.095413_1_plen_173_part_10